MAGVVVPRLGVTVKTVTIVEWLADDGATVPRAATPVPATRSPVDFTGWPRRLSAQPTGPKRAGQLADRRT
jgi:hypothetical protein